MTTTCLTARWIVPVSSPPLHNGTITIHDGIIVALESHGRSTPTHNLGDVAILPGLVNAHTHLDLTGAAGRFPPVRPITNWLKQVVGYRLTRSIEQIKQDIDTGLQQLSKSGTSVVGDISFDGGSMPALEQANMSGVVFRELIGLGNERGASVAGAGRAWLNEGDESLLRRELSPHASYSAGQVIFNSLLWSDTVCTHLAESQEEVQLLDHRTGPFVPYLQSLGAWHPSELLTMDEILAVAHRVKRFVVAHGNYLKPDQWRSLPKSASVVYCPRTHASFGHEPHPYRGMLTDGVNVALGTDSLASNPDLSVWNEAKFLFSRGEDPRMLLEMLTTNGARALGLVDDFGTLEAGKQADMVSVPTNSTDYESIFTNTAIPELVFRNGWVRTACS
jgi:cytosine/adenosine deaminase-related metal-dependent hydrolase